MAKKLHLVDLDLNKNQLLNAVLQNLATAPENPFVGQIYHNTTDDTTYVWTGTVWLDLGAIYTHPDYTALTPTLTGTNVLASFETNGQGHVIAATTRLLTLANLGYTGDSDANKYIHATFSGNTLSGAPLTAAKVISNVTVNSEGHVTGFATRDITPADIGAAVVNDSVTNAVNTWSSQKIQSELTAINNTIAGALVYQTGYNASTNTPNLTSPAEGVVKKGYVYTVTAAGTFHGEGLQIGDMMVAETNDPTARADWTLVNKNIPDIVDASTTEKGIIELATQTEVNTGTDSTRAVTPLTLAQRLLAAQSANRYSQDLGDGTTTAYTITHNLNSLDILTQVKQKATGTDIVCEAIAATVNTLQLKFNIAPAADSLRVTILK